MIYLDHAATSLPKPEPVVMAVTAAMNCLGNSGRGAHSASLGASRMIYETREALSDFFGGDGPEQVVFTPNATAALNTVIQGILNPGDRAVTTAMEHNSVLRPLYRMEKQGVSLCVVPADEKGRLSMERLEQELKPGTKALFCTHASNVTGNVNDLKTIGTMCRDRGILFVADVSQSAGILPIDMKEMAIDILCFTGHKGLLGPQGTGGICVRKGISVRPLIVGGSGILSYSREHPAQMPVALEAGTLNGHGIAGLQAALTYIREQGQDILRKKELELMWYFYDQVSRLSQVTVYGDFSSRKALRTPVVSLNIGEEDSGWAAGELAERYGIQTRAGAHCAPLMHEALKTRDRGAVRFSFSHLNTREETEMAVYAVEQLCREVE